VADNVAANEARGAGDEDGERFGFHAPRRESTEQRSQF